MSTASHKPLLKSVPYWTAFGVLTLAAVGLGAAISHYGLYLKKLSIQAPGGRLLSAIPTETPTWQRIGNDRREQADIEVVLGTTNYVSRLYHPKPSSADSNKSPEGPFIDFHAAYYTGQIDTVPHVPDRCFVGGGLALGNVVGERQMTLDATRWESYDSVPDHLKGRIFRARADSDGVYYKLPRDPASIKLNVMEFVGKEGKPLYAGYFFIANGGTVAKAEGVRLLAFDLTSTYAYYCKVQFTSSSFSNPEDFVNASSKLLDELLPEIVRCLPDWVEVEQGTYPPDNPNRKAPATEPSPSGKP